MDVRIRKPRRFNRAGHTVAWALFLFYTQEGHKIARCAPHCQPSTHIHSKVVSYLPLALTWSPPSECRGRWAAGRTTQSCAVGCVHWALGVR